MPTLLVQQGRIDAGASAHKAVNVCPPSTWPAIEGRRYFPSMAALEPGDPVRAHTGQKLLRSSLERLPKARARRDVLLVNMTSTKAALLSLGIVPRAPRLPADIASLQALAALSFCPVSGAERRARTGHIRGLITEALAESAGGDRPTLLD